MKTTKTRASVAVAVNGWGKLFCVLCVLASFAARGAIDDPVAYWSFDDAGGLLVNQVTASPHHNASVLFGTPGAGVAEGASGIVGNALVLDGTAGIRLPYHQDNLGTSFTLSLWYWQQTNDTRQCVYQTRDNYDLTYEAPGVGSTFASYVGQGWVGTLTTGQKEWIHLVHAVSTVGNTTTLSVYTNGVFALSRSVTSNDVFHANQVRGFHIGAYRLATGPADGRCFKGMIDELALWGHALSADEVEAVYQRGVGGLKLAFTAVPVPVISLGGRDLSFALNADSGFPAGLFSSGWLRHGVQDPAYSFTAADTAGTLFDYVPDTAGHASGPFHAEIADVKWRVPLTEALRQVPQGDYTLETWIRTTYLDRGTLMGNHYNVATPNGVVNFEFFGANNVRLYQRNLSGAITDLNRLATNVNTRNGQWHHVAGIREGSTMRLYVDGQEVGSTNTPLGNYTLSSDYLYLGRDERTTVAFNGEQGATRIWTRALSSSELAGIVALGLPGGNAVSRDDLLVEYDLHAPFNASKPGVGLPGYQISVAPPKFKQMPMTNFTCEAVFRTTAPNIASTILMGNWSNNMYSAVNLQLEDNNTVRLYMRNTAGTVASLAKVPANVNTRDGQWHRLAAVRGNNTMALYLDGQLVGSQAETLGAYPLQGPFYFLGRDGRDPWFNRFVGDIAAARIWTRALSADELAGLAASNAVPADGLLAQYAPMLTNSLVTAGFPNRRFLRSFTTRTNSATLVFSDLPRHDKIGLGMLLAQLDQMEPVAGGDRFVIRADGTEVLSVGLGSNQGGEPQVSTLSVLGVPADVGVIKNTLTCGDDLFFCGTAWNDYRDHVYDLALLEPLQSIPHSADTLVVELLGIHDAPPENEGFGIDRFELTVYPRRGTMFFLR